LWATEPNCAASSLPRAVPKFGLFKRPGFNNKEEIDRFHGDWLHIVFTDDKIESLGQIYRYY
jgi:hypothetical protein